MHLNKKIFFVIFIVILLMGSVFIVLSRKQEKTLDMADEDSWYFDYMGRSFSDQGCFYSDNGYLHFCDPVSSLDVLICDRADCRHEEEECTAYFGIKTYACISGDKLLVLSDYNKTVYGEMGLYEASLNGTNRREIVSFRDIQNITGLVISEDYMWIGCYSQYDENLEPLEENVAKIVVYNRRTGEQKVVWSESNVNALISSMDVHGDELFFSYFAYDIDPAELAGRENDYDFIKKYERYEFIKVTTDGQSELICNDLENLTASFCGDEIFFCRKGSLYSYNVTEKVEKQLAESMLQIPAFLEGKAVFYASGQDDLSIYTSESAALETTGGNRNGLSPIAVFDKYTYLWDYSSGNGELGFMLTEEFLRGDFLSFHPFEIMLE